MAVAYIMAVTTLSWRDALNAVRGARSIANPNFGFQRQLHDYESDRINEERRRIRVKFPPSPFADEEECLKLIVAYHRSSRLNEPCEAACRRNAQAPYRVQASRHLKDCNRVPNPARDRAQDTDSPLTSPQPP